MSLKTKLILAFCGPAAILVLVGVMSVGTVSESNQAMERIFRENYDSIAACLGMKQAIERLDRTAELSVWEEIGEPLESIRTAIIEFERNLTFQQGNVTLPGEYQLNEQLAAHWKAYRSKYEDFTRPRDAGKGHRDIYRQHLLPLSLELRDTVQQIIDMNLNNMVSLDGQARRRAGEMKQRVLASTVVGVGLAIGFMIIAGPWMVRPIVNLTRSVREIQRGNLDLVVNVHSNDEIGQLGKAFNEMATRLRELRRSNLARLLRTRQATELALNSLSDAVAICSPEGRIELANEAARRIFNLAPDGMVSEAGNEEVTRLFERARDGLRPERSKGYSSAIQIFKDGNEHFFLPEAIPFLNEEQQLIGVTLVLSDVTRMRSLDEVKSGLVSTVSHELKTPLTSMRLAVHVLLSEKLGPLTPAQVEILTTARDDSDRLHHIIERLLDIGEIESGHCEIEPQSVPAEQLILQGIEGMRAAFQDRGIILEIQVPADTRPVLADVFRLRIVFANLLQNALKHTPPGGRVTVSARDERDHVCFEVADTGEGIPEEYLSRVFDRFFRVPGQNREQDSGLGLAIVKEIIQAHGGRIEVSSRKRQGTRFTFTLPGE
jgi:signal transduction histidine kinase/HAMP domain-containing protein